VLEIVNRKLFFQREEYKIVNIFNGTVIKVRSSE